VRGSDHAGPNDHVVDDGQAMLPFEQESDSVPLSDVPFDLALLSLAGLEGFGHKGLRSLVRHFGDQLGAVWQTSPTEMGRLLADARVPAADRLSRAIFELHQSLLEKGHDRVRELRTGGVAVIPPSRIPHRLAELSDRPWWLFVEGSSEVLYRGPHIAVVGTRDPSPQGIKATEIVVRTMAPYPVTLVSGLANGIDAAAHNVALRDGVQNVAFLGHGVNLTFPAETAQVRRRIVETGGAVVTEYLPADHYRKQYFVQRNRLQAGLSNLVVAAEGTAAGGTAHTVRFASAYGRELLGLRWDGAGNLVNLVADQPRAAVLDIFEDDARRQLDQRLRQLADAEGQDTYALRLVDLLLEREARLRVLRPEDTARLRARLEEIARGAG
jgi:DNA processing protein